MMPAAHPDDASHQRQALVGWFMRRQARPASAEDELAFQRWLSAPGNRAAYARWEADWALMDAMPKASADRLRALAASDHRASLAASGHATGRRRILGGGFALAGVVAMAATVGWLGRLHFQALPVHEQAFRTTRGQQSEVVLPDGSTLRLDTATALSATFFRDRREVRLTEGQAMFAVASDVRRPFQVAAGPIRVTVVGTRFSVRLTPGIPGREGVEVAVEEGRVRVARGPESPGEGSVPEGGWPAPDFELVAGQRLVFDDRGLRPALGSVAADGVAAWRSMPLSFSDVPLGQVLAELERYQDLGILAIDPAVAGLHLSGTFDPRNAAATRRLLVGALPVRMEPRTAGWALVPLR